MAVFKSDAQGFLLGERLLDNSTELLRVQSAALPVWRDIRKDVRSIARQIGAATTASRRGSNTAVAVSAQTTAQPAGRRSAGRAGAASLPGSQSAPLSQRDRAARASVALPQRDGRGRFVARPTAAAAEEVLRDRRGRFTAGGGGSAAGGGSGAGDENKPGGGQAGAISRGLVRVADKLGQIGAGGATENLDPTINAAREIKDVVAPLGRGLGGLFGRSAERKREQAKERWYKKMWLQLTSPAFARRRQAAERTGGGSSWLGGLFGSGAGLVGGLAARVPGLLGAVLMRVFLPVAALWGSFKLGQWIGEKINTWLEQSGMQRRLFDAVDWIKETVSGAWGVVTQKAGDAWANVTNSFADGVKSLLALPGRISAIFDNLDAAVRKIPVIGDAYAKAADTVSTAAKEVRRGYEEAGSGSTAPAGSVPAAVGGAFARARGWVLGQTSKLFESGKAGAAAVSTGKGDAGGASYGTYQLSSKAGTLSKFLASSGYGDQFAGLTPGTPAFDAKWRQVAKSDPAFAAAQHDFIKATHYEPAVARLKGAGIDLSGRGDAVRDALWSTSVQFGAGDARRGTGAVALVSKALGGKDVAQMTDAQIVAAIQDYKIANNATLFASSDAKTRAGTLARAGTEKEALLRMAMSGSPGAPGSVRAAVPALTAADLPRMPEVKEPPTKLNRDAEKPAVTVRLPEGLGQDVGDRQLAHIVTGGIGS